MFIGLNDYTDKIVPSKAVNRNRGDPSDLQHVTLNRNRLSPLHQVEIKPVRKHWVLWSNAEGNIKHSGIGCVEFQ